MVLQQPQRGDVYPYEGVLRNGVWYAVCRYCRALVPLGRPAEGLVNAAEYAAHLADEHPLAAAPTSEEEARCPACGDYMSYCQGHGPQGDPEGYRRLRLHDMGNHHLCDPRACEEAPRDE